MAGLMAVMLMATQLIAGISSQDLVDKVIQLNGNSTVGITGTNVFSVAIPAAPDPMTQMADVLEISTTLLSHLESDDVIYFMAIHGRSSETWKMQSKGQRSVVLLCLDQTIRSGVAAQDSILVVARSQAHHNLSAGSTVNSSVVHVAVHRPDMTLPFGQVLRANVTDLMPLTLLINHSNRSEAYRRDRFLLTVDSVDPSSNGVCIMIAVQNRECPLKNRPDNIETAEMYATALKTATLTIRSDKFRFIEPFFVSIIVLPDDVKCHSRPGEDRVYAEGSFSGMNSSPRVKQVAIRIDTAAPYSTYVTPIILPIICMLMVVVLSCGVLIAKKTTVPKTSATEKSTHSVELASGVHVEKATNSMELASGCFAEKTDVDAVATVDETDQNTSLTPCIEAHENGADPDTSNSHGLDQNDGVDQLGSDQVAFELANQCLNEIKVRKRERRIRIRRGLNRLKEEPKVSDMTSILNDDVWFRRNRSRVYLYLMPIVCIFYFVPAIQFVFLSKQTEEMIGSQDVCFHNFRCAKPLHIFSDFNHIISNISYIIFGCAFLVMVYIKSKILPESNNPKNDHFASTGIVQQLSIFYAMGLGLIFQGFFSVCYHVCPSNLSLQFDTTMMYVICLLCHVKIYQFRHPDATANAYSIFMFLGCLVLLEAFALYSSSWWVFAIFLVFYISMTIFIAFDSYFIGIGRLDTLVARVLAKDILTNFKPISGHGRRASFIKYPGRFAFVMFFCAINFVHAIVTVYLKWKDPKKSVSHVVLFILAGNLIFYLFYYVLRKNCPQCFCAQATSHFGPACIHRRIRCSIFGHQIWLPVPVSAGSFFSVTAFLFGGVALYLYQDRTANRNWTPAESRNLNEDCTFLDFYDNHDLWHFFGAAGIFMAFMSLLTLDDDLLSTSREQIDVF